MDEPEIQPATAKNARSFLHWAYLILGVIFGGVVGLIAGLVVGVWVFIYSLYEFPANAMRDVMKNVDEGFWGPREEPNNEQEKAK